MSHPLDSFPRIDPDPIFAVAAQAKAAGPGALDASIGVLLDDTGTPRMFGAVRQAFADFNDNIQQDGNLLYPPLSGYKPYLEAVSALVFGDKNIPLARLATAGGTGALAVNLRLAKALGYQSVILPSPSWANHASLIAGAGMAQVSVSYFTADQPSVTGILDALKDQESPHLILLQTGCHNPTGRVLPVTEWTRLFEALTDTPHLLLLDCAYQGLGQGLSEDVWPVQECLTRQVPFLLAWSASKNHGLYGTRSGCAFAVVPQADQLERANTLYGRISRQLYSTAPLVAQHLLATVHQQYQADWQTELEQARSELLSKRQRLAELLPQYASELDGEGLFVQLPLSSEQVTGFQSQKIFLTMSGRVNIAGIPMERMEEFAAAVQK